MRRLTPMEGVTRYLLIYGVNYTSSPSCALSTSSFVREECRDAKGWYHMWYRPGKGKSRCCWSRKRSALLTSMIVSIVALCEVTFLVTCRDRMRRIDWVGQVRVSRETACQEQVTHPRHEEDVTYPHHPMCVHQFNSPSSPQRRFSFTLVCKKTLALQ